MYDTISLQMTEIHTLALILNSQLQFVLPFDPWAVVHHLKLNFSKIQLTFPRLAPLVYADPFLLDVLFFPSSGT